MRDGRKVAEVATNGDTLTFNSRPLMELGAGRVLGVPWSVLVVLAVFVVCQVVATRTTAGRTLYAVGANPRAGRLFGINLAGCRFWVFVASGAAAGLAGALLSGQAATAVPSAGVAYELLAITAVLLGGTSLRGEGSVAGIVECWVRPLVELASKRESKHSIALLAREAGDATADARSVVSAHLDPSVEVCLQALRAALPGVEDTLIVQGCLWMIAAAMSTITAAGRAQRLAGRAPMPRRPDALLAPLVAFTAGGLLAIAPTAAPPS